MASKKSGRNPDTPADPEDQESEGSALAKKIAAKKPPRPAQCRNFIRSAVAESMPLIVGAFVEQATDGSVSHFNLLTKVGGFDHRPLPAPTRRRGKSFAQRLLDNIEEHEAKMLAANEARMAAERAPGK